MNYPNMLCWNSWRRAGAGLMAVGLVSALATGCVVSDDDSNNGQATNNNIDPDDCSEFEEIGGDITSPMTLEGCISVTRDVEVKGDGHITIAPGTLLLFGEDVGVEVWNTGRLTAEGTAESGIVMTGENETPGFWKGLSFNSSNGSENKLDYVTIDYAGGENNGFVESAALALGDWDGPVKLSVRNSTLRNSASVGFYSKYNADITFENNTLTQNAGGAASLHADNVGELDAGSTYTGNDADFVYIFGSSVDNSQTWQNLDAPYFVTKSLEYNAATLEIAAGTTLVFGEDVGVEVWNDARLKAVGTETEPITFTGAEELNGFWKGLSYNSTNSTDNVLDHVIIEYGGSSNNGFVEPANLALGDWDGTARVKLTNSVLRNGGAAGLYAKPDVTLEGFANNTITGNDEGAALIHASTAGDLDAGSTYTGNGEDFVYLYGANISSDQTWQNLDVDYYVTKTLEFNSATLEIAPGTTVVFGQDIGVEVWDDARLKAVGTESDPITFTGAEKFAGFWKGLSYNSSLGADNILEHVVIEYGGSSNNGFVEPANLALGDWNGPARVTINDLLIREAGADGIYVESGDTSLAGCSNVTFEAVSGQNYSGNGAGCSAP